MSGNDFLYAKLTLGPKSIPRIERERNMLGNLANMLRSLMELLTAGLYLVTLVSLIVSDIRSLRQRRTPSGQTIG